MTAFLKACGNGLKDIASLLVQHDADILAVNNEGEDAMAILQSKIWLDDRPTYQRTLQYIHDLKHDILLTQQLMEFTTSFLDEDEDRA